MSKEEVYIILFKDNTFQFSRNYPRKGSYQKGTTCYRVRADMPIDQIFVRRRTTSALRWKNTVR